MPTRLCCTPRCPEVATYRGRCGIHARTREHETHHNKHVYNTKRWKLLRRAILIEYPICQACDQALALDVDHIQPIQAGGAPYDPQNLQALCAPCHGAKTKQEQAA